MEFMRIPRIESEVGPTDTLFRRHESKASLLEKLKLVFAELLAAVDDALRDEDTWPVQRIRRASDLLRLVNPDALSESARGGLTAWRMRLLKAHIEVHLGGTIKNKDLAALVGLTEAHFCRTFKHSFGEAPHRYILRLRIDRARQLLLTTEASLAQIAAECGLADQSHFSKLFRKYEGQTPGAWRRARATGQPHRFSSAPRADHLPVRFVRPPGRGVALIALPRMPAQT